MSYEPPEKPAVPPARRAPLIDTRVGAILAVCVLLVSVPQAYQVHENARALSTTTALAEQGAEAHAGLCGLKVYFDGQVKDSQKFLKLTQDERRRLYGSIGDIPDSAIRASLVKEQRIAGKLAAVRCP